MSDKQMQCARCYRLQSLRACRYDEAVPGYFCPDCGGAVVFVGLNPPKHVRVETNASDDAVLLDSLRSDLTRITAENEQDRKALEQLKAGDETVPL